MSWVAAGIAGGSALAGGALSFFGGQSQAKAIRQAMQQYLDYQKNQRQTFLDQPETGAIRSKLQSYIGGDVGYNPDTVNNMKQGVYEDYGKSLSDMTRLINQGGAGSSGIYTPGNASRTAQLLGNNIAANRANAIRDINTKNADVALNNQRLAISALPTYMPGLPATPSASPDVFQGLNSVAPAGSYLGPAVSQAGQSASNAMIWGPISQRMMGGSSMQAWDPLMGTGPNPYFVPGYGPGSSFYQSWAPNLKFPTE